MQKFCESALPINTTLLLLSDVKLFNRAWSALSGDSSHNYDGTGPRCLEKLGKNRENRIVSSFHQINGGLVNRIPSHGFKISFQCNMSGLFYTRLENIDFVTKVLCAILKIIVFSREASKISLKNTVNRKCEMPTNSFSRKLWSDGPSSGFVVSLAVSVLTPEK